MKYKVLFEVNGVEDEFYIEGDDLIYIEEYVNQLIYTMRASLIGMEEV